MNVNHAKNTDVEYANLQQIVVNVLMDITSTNYLVQHVQFRTVKIVMLVFVLNVSRIIF